MENPNLEWMRTGGYLYDPPETSIWFIEWEHLYFFYCSSVDTGHFLAENQDFWWCHGAPGIMVDPRIQLRYTLDTLNFPVRSTQYKPFLVKIKGWFMKFMNIG